MTLQPITSSMLSHIGWEPDTLYVRYHPNKKQQAAGEPGDLWQYRHYSNGIPETQPEEGWGRWFLANVKGKYDGEKVVPVEQYQAALEDLRATIKRDTDLFVESMKADIRDNPLLKPGTPILGTLEFGGKFTPAKPGETL